MEVNEIINQLKSMSNPEDAAGMARFGINTEKAFGIRIPVLRKIAKDYGRDHELAQALWDSGYHEARILASMVDDPKLVTEAQMEAWALDFNSWDLCDQVCGNLFDKAPMGFEKAVAWTGRPEEFVKRAGFAIPAWGAFHLKKLPDSAFEVFFPLMVREATDKRNFVKKAVNWALRNIGKRNLALHARAIEVAEQIAAIDDKTAQWIASDALRELRSEKIVARLKK
jgi:3-methyladenine DNA glycosylase AlkD